MTTLQEVHVSINPGERACQTRWDGNDWRHGSSGFNVTFISQVGDVPLLTTPPPSNVTETVKGTKENLECGRQGYCDHESGLCRCLKGFVGSDGDGTPGGGGIVGAADPGVHAKSVGRAVTSSSTSTRAHSATTYFPGVSCSKERLTPSSVACQNDSRFSRSGDDESDPRLVGVRPARATLGPQDLRARASRSFQLPAARSRRAFCHTRAHVARP